MHVPRKEELLKRLRRVCYRGLLRTTISDRDAAIENFHRQPQQRADRTVTDQLTPAAQQGTEDHTPALFPHNHATFTCSRHKKEGIHKFTRRNHTKGRSLTASGFAKVGQEQTQQGEQTGERVALRQFSVEEERVVEDRGPTRLANQHCVWDKEPKYFSRHARLSDRQQQFFSFRRPRL